MSVSFDIKSKIANYNVTVKSGAFDVFKQGKIETTILADSFFKQDLPEQGCIIFVDADEDAKNLIDIPKIIIRMRALSVTRQTKLMVIGGGILQDIGTFCASIYMRGIEWDYMPTTLLGMVDSCIGGKSSINVGGYKNLVGNFHPPKSVVIDPLLIASLNTEQKIAGLLEAVKICYAKDPDTFDAYIKLNTSFDMDIKTYTEVIILSLRSKKWFIEVDEFDKAERLLLNFGHTFGHALEGSSNFEISHGLAVGLGMLIAIEHSLLIYNLDYPSHHAKILSSYIESLLENLPELRSILQAIDMEKLFDCFISDKKHTADCFAIIIPNKDGNLERVIIEKSETNINNIKGSISKVLRKMTQ